MLVNGAGRLLQRTPTVNSVVHVLYLNAYEYEHVIVVSDRLMGL